MIHHPAKGVYILFIKIPLLRYMCSAISLLKFVTIYVFVTKAKKYFFILKTKEMFKTGKESKRWLMKLSKQTNDQNEWPFSSYYRKSHPRDLIIIIVFFASLSLFHIKPLFLSLTHTHKHTLTVSFSHAQTYTHYHTLFHVHTLPIALSSTYIH